jgi:protein-arginine kinase activator protein McsA
MNCYSCNKQKANLEPTKSALISGITLFLCATCLEEKLEPRWVIILAGRQNGTEYVRDYIIKRRYIGNTISGEELIA